MILSIFNFKYVRIIAAVLLTAALAFVTEIYIRAQYAKINPDAILTRINKEKPDIILLGNSMLGMNVDNKIFNQELSRLEGRDIKSTFIVFNASHGPLFYLIIKNQISRSNAAGIPLVIIDHSPRLFASTGSSGPIIEKIKGQLRDHEDIFLEKYYDPSLRIKYYLHSFSSAIYYAPECSRYLLNPFVGFFCKIAGIAQRPQHLLKVRFGHPTEMRSDKIQDEEDWGALNKIDYDRSFLPDIFKETSRFKLVFVLAHLNPDSEVLSQEFFKSLYFSSISDFKEYVQLNNGKVLDMNQFKELDNGLLYRDEDHFNQTGVVINSKLLAKIIYDNGLIK